MLPVALDAMGGDKAPDEIVAGAHRAVAELGVPVVLVGQPEVLGPLAGDLEVIPASEVIAMDADPAPSVRKMKDSSLVRAAEAVRDGKASAMVSAGNTGATMGSALLRMGRIKGVTRPAIATPIPVPGPARPRCCSTPAPTPSAQPELLLQFAQMGTVFARERYGIAEPRVGPAVDRRGAHQGHAARQGDPRAAGRLRRRWSRPAARFIGNVEGRDVMTADVDVVVTDGFTGNVVLKTLEGGMRTLVGAIFEAFGSSPEAKAASDVLLPALLPLYAHARPRQHGRGHAPRRRRPVPDLPRLLVGHGHRERRAGGQGAPRRRRSSSRLRRPSPPPEPHGPEASGRRSQAHKVGGPVCSPGPDRREQEPPCPPRPTSNEDPWTASRCSS